MIYSGVMPGHGDGHHDWTRDGRVYTVVTPWNKPGHMGLDGVVDELLAGTPPGRVAFYHATKDAQQHVWQTWHRYGVVSIGPFSDTVGDWTLLAAWDYTGDHRGGSYSAFVLPGTLTTEAAIKEARRLFPAVWARIGGAP